MPSDEEDFDGDFDSDGKVDSDGEVDSSEEEDVVGEGESIDQEVHQEFSHLEEHFGEYFISQPPFALTGAHLLQANVVRLISGLPQSFFLDWAAMMEVDTASHDYSPFPSKLFSLLFILLNSPRPLVCTCTSPKWVFSRQ